VLLISRLRVLLSFFAEQLRGWRLLVSFFIFECASQFGRAFHWPNHDLSVLSLDKPDVPRQVET